jgi:hypothetical protein
MIQNPFGSDNTHNSTNQNEQEENDISSESYYDIFSINKITKKTLFQFPDNLSLNKLESDFNEEYFKSLFIQNKKSIKKNKIKFITSTKKKRGKQSKRNPKKEIHSSTTYDNILRKIQTHFLNFLISFINDCVKSQARNKKVYFKKFNYDMKKQISKAYLDEIKHLTIKNILEKIEISKKYTRSKSNVNKENLKKFSHDSWFKKLFEMKFLELFEYYYNDAQPLNKISLFGKTITFSENTFSFNKLIEANDGKGDFINITEMYYINDIKNMEIAKRIKNYSDDALNLQEANN